ncbi:hypothetical protein BDY17DRAFT_136172 [Neohortaea acidophila]|uniref:Uncharacterized protein n=1 Tax=Neohortaea acidophila TaxID=245834 RepID=A0A6A6PRY4_9PEZI|nr:uncharacterized protein BDY17DRAFT_136172 [Neohortaea acidophila]KAF2482859.1 hypothetical protein BDY17DRAFT_136172 [Neohortaea acidophila]
MLSPATAHCRFSRSGGENPDRHRRHSAAGQLRLNFMPLPLSLHTIAAALTSLSTKPPFITNEHRCSSSSATTRYHALLPFVAICPLFAVPPPLHLSSRSASSSQCRLRCTARRNLPALHHTSLSSPPHLHRNLRTPLAACSPRRIHVLSAVPRRNLHNYRISSIATLRRVIDTARAKR